MDGDETTERAVIGPLDLVRETTGRELIHSQVIAKTFATVALAGARLVGAVAALEVPTEAGTLFIHRHRPNLAGALQSGKSFPPFPAYHHIFETI